MKKIVFLLLASLCLPETFMAQNVEDDLYYVPTRKKAEQKKEQKAHTDVQSTADNVIVVEAQKPVVRVASTGNTTVVVKDKKGNVRDVDEYNRRYDSKEYSFAQAEDTLFIKEKAIPDPDGEWVNGFDGSEDDYEYAMRIIRFRNPRYAISISSPLYWDVVYGLSSWDWNVYTDGLYAYAFPTFSNRLWWDWRYGWDWGWPYYGWNWGWNSFYFGWGGFYAGWTGWYGPGWGWHYPHYAWHHHHGYWGPRDTYTSRRSIGVRGGGISRSSAGFRATTTNGTTRVTGQARRTVGSSTGRVVGTRSTTRSSSMRSTSAGSRRSTYTRPSSTRSTSYGIGQETSTLRQNESTGRRGTPSYNRGSSTMPSRTYQSQSRRNNSYNNNNNTRSYNSRSSQSRSSFSTGGGGSSFRSSGGGVSRSGGGGSSRRR